MQRPNPKKNMGGWDPMPELTISSAYLHSRVDSNALTLATLCQSHLNLMPE